MARILVVDDSDLARSLIGDVIARSGHEVSTAPGGREALEKLGAGKFDLLVTDYMMPEMNGAELVANVRRLYSSLKVLVISSYYDSEILPRDQGPGDAMLRKPFRNEDLLAEVARLLAS